MKILKVQWNRNLFLQSQIFGRIVCGKIVYSLLSLCRILCLFFSPSLPVCLRACVIFSECSSGCFKWLFVTNEGSTFMKYFRLTTQWLWPWFVQTNRTICSKNVFMDEDVVVGFIVVMEIRKGIEWKYVDVCMTCHAMLFLPVSHWAYGGCVRWINLANTQIHSHDTMRLVAASGEDIVP